jgi:glycosyltransferase involved in cell wall biosynthesis
MTAPLISVLVTVYNRERFLAACLESILASSFADFELIIVDDGSTDDSVAIAEHWETLDRRIHVYRNGHNLGDYPNRMRAAERSQGRYLKYVDSDDLIYPHGLSVMVTAMESHPQAALGLSHSAPEDEKPYPWLLDPAEEWAKEFLGSGCMGSGPTGAIIRRDAFFVIGGFGNWGVLSDTDMWYRLSAHWPIVLVPPGLVWWRRHDEQEFSTRGADVVYLEKGYELALDALLSADCPLSPEDTRSAVRRARQRYARRLLSLALRRRRPRTALRLLRRSDMSANDLVSGFRPYS